MKKLLGFLALAALLFVAAPTKPAQALSLLNPAAAAAAAEGHETLTTDVRWRRWGYRRHYGYRRNYGYRRHYYRPRYYHRRYRF